MIADHVNLQFIHTEFKGVLQLGFYVHSFGHSLHQISAVGETFRCFTEVEVVIMHHKKSERELKYHKQNKSMHMSPGQDTTLSFLLVNGEINERLKCYRIQNQREQ